MSISNMDSETVDKLTANKREKSVWHRPCVALVDIKNTFNGSGSNGDGGSPTT